MGSVFSPYYARACWRRPGAVDPLDHCALNVALYGAGGKRWSMTERGRGAVRYSDREFTIGPSNVAWDGSALSFEINEVSVPLPSRIRGTVKLYPEALPGYAPFALDAAGRHRWWPIAPSAPVEVNLDKPGLRWRGRGYFDHNLGEEPLAQAFSRWDWSRAGLSNGDTAVLYHTTTRAGERRPLAIRIDRAGQFSDFPPPPLVPLPTARWWRIKRETQAEDGQVSIKETLEDTPFYARSLLATKLLGEPVTAVHESLSLDRYATTWVKLLLPFRMPRRTILS